MTLRVGVIGVGAMGSIHAEHLASRVPGARLEAIAETNPKRAKAAAKRSSAISFTAEKPCARTTKGWGGAKPAPGFTSQPLSVVPAASKATVSVMARVLPMASPDTAAGAGRMTRRRRYTTRTQVTSAPMRQAKTKIVIQPIAAAYFTTRSSDAAESGSAPRSVTSEVRPSVMARPPAASNRIMWRKNTMPGASGTGLPV